MVDDNSFILCANSDFQQWLLATWERGTEDSGAVQGG